MTDEFEVAVVGGGPAGATAARELAERGIRTVVLERACVPRYKTCAGGLPVRTAALLPFDVGPVVEDAVDRMVVSLHGRRRYLRHARHVYAYMMMRDRLDALLLEKAAGAGAQVRDGTALRRAWREDGRWSLDTDRGRLVARFLIGADGANSAVARATGLGRGLAESIAMEAEVEPEASTLDAWRRTVGIELGYRPRGYGWVFPKAELLSVGVVLPADEGGRVKSVLAGQLARLGLTRAPARLLTGHKVLFRRGPVPIAGEGACLVGDAAGLADEFSEEGIYYAVRSGQLAAAAVVAGGDGSLGEYQEAVDREIQPELDAARVIADLFYASLDRWPWAVMVATEQIGYLWEALFRVQLGESSYDRELARVPRVVRLLKLLVRP